ncbi:hypothetical protein Pint_21387 [Pistacia integerrima]|uniref:Uncharacterized protein n=1 Tax=Pistacia integerrima TaxID=434235 RepID=A0ACC0X9H3_9ROSI|nr:hypothetical protein Pint_21387 [Pistacia integerrima]
MSGGQDNSGKGQNPSNEKPIEIPGHASVAGRNDQEGTGKNPSNEKPIEIPGHASVAGRNDQQGTGNNPSPDGPTPIYSPSAVAAPDQGTPGPIDKPQKHTFAPTHSQVNSDGSGRSNQKDSKM